MTCNHNNITKYLNSRLPLLIYVVSILSIVAYIPHYNYIIDIISQFKIQYFYFGLFTIIYFVFINIRTPRKLFKIFIILSSLIIVLNICDICKNYTPIKKLNNENSLQVKIGHFNVLTKNNNYFKILAQVEKETPDIILLEEVNEKWLKNITEIRTNYPYYFEHPRDDNFGIALYSKIPLKKITLEEWTDWEVPVIKADINNDTSLYYVHTLPPIKAYIQYRNNMLEIINQMVIKNEKNIIIAGDLNTDRFSFAYKNYIGKTNMQNAQPGFGLKGTWPSSFPPFMRIEIDHILTLGNISVSEFKIGQKIGSDHLPVFAVINFKIP